MARVPDDHVPSLQPSEVRLTIYQDRGGVRAVGLKSLGPVPLKVGEHVTFEVVYLERVVREE